MIFDCHTHIDWNKGDHPLSLEGRNIIFNAIEEYLKFNNSGINFKSDISMALILDIFDENFIENKLWLDSNISAWKIHSRIQKLDRERYDQLISFLDKQEIPRPIIYDAFYHGPELSFQPKLEIVVELSKRFPDVPIIVAHAGGYRILEYFFHLRGLDNIYFDLSFSLQYLRDSSTYWDMKKLIRFTSDHKLMFGTDFPFADASMQLDVFYEVLKEINASQTKIERALYQNAFELFVSGTKNRI